VVEFWESEGGDYLFHYTEAAYARQVAADEHFLVGPGALFGPGLYATDISPEDASPDEIRAICFGGDAPTIAFDGVLVLLGDDPLQPFVEVEPRIFVLPAEDGIGEIIPMHSLLVGFGQRKLGNSWEIQTWP
jgi:hypothetical protein